MGLAGSRLDQRVDETDEGEPEQDDREPRRPRSSGLEAAGDDQELAQEERRRRQTRERPEREPHRGAQAAFRPPDAGHTVRRRARLVADERRRGVEAERLRDRVGGDVDGDPGDRERRREADPERDHAHVLEARIREQALPGERPPQERNRNRQRDEPEPDQHVLRRVRADHGRERVLRAPGNEQHARQERRREQSRDGRGRLRVRVGKPVVDGRPADLGREAGQQEQVGDERRLRA